jgi:ABC-type enterochelin transport system substrate-binding protein
MPSPLSDKQRIFELEQQMLRLVRLFGIEKQAVDERVVVLQQQVATLTAAMANLNNAMDCMAAAANVALQLETTLPNGEAH